MKGNDVLFGGEGEDFRMRVIRITAGIASYLVIN